MRAGHAPRAQDGGDAHQVVVVHPDEIVGPAGGEDRVREALVDGLVGGPVGGREMAHRNQIVEERPDDLVGEPGIEPVPLGLRQRDGDELVAEAAAGVLEERPRIGKLLLGGPRPPDPPPAAVAEHGAQGRDQAPARGLDLPAARLLVARDGKRKAVRHDHESHGRSEEQAAFHSSRKSRSSPGGRSQASARVGRFSGRTRTARPPPRDRLEGVLVGAVVAEIRHGRTGSELRERPLDHTALVEAARPQLDASVERLELETVGERAGGHALAQHRLGETIERRARAPRVERDSERLPLGDGPGADGFEEGNGLVEAGVGVSGGRRRDPRAVAGLALEPVRTPEIGASPEPRETRELGDRAAADDPDARSSIGQPLQRFPHSGIRLGVRAVGRSAARGFRRSR